MAGGVAQQVAEGLMQPVGVRADQQGGWAGEVELMSARAPGVPEQERRT